MRVTLDFETRSTCELKHSGAYKYSLDPTTKPTCLAFKVRGNKTVFFLDFEKINRQWKDQPFSFRNIWLSLIDTGYLFVAHNAFFETCIYKNILVKRYGWPDISFRQFRCTAAKAAACALPRNLEGAGHALNLTTQKDKRGYVAMMKTCKPTKEHKLWVTVQTDLISGKKVSEKKKKLARIDAPCPPLFLEPEAAPDVWETLYRYCKIDVLTEELLDSTLPDLIPQEQEIWFLNQTLNWRGLRIDIPTVKKIVGIMGIENEVKLKELDSLTMGLVTKPGARQAILEFLALEGIELPDIRAKTVDDVLKEGKLSPDMKRLLELRKALSMTSTKKYQSFLNRAGKDERVRDILLYHGAHTGRDAGTGINPQNFPKGLIPVDPSRPYAAVENILECDTETLKLLYGENLSILFSAVLRNLIVPSPGKELFVADFSKIEVAVLWWLADNWPGLKVLTFGKDPYIYQAMANTGKGYDEITDDERQLGKAQILGGGFGMGWEKFQSTAWEMYRLKLTEEQSRFAIQSYRTANAAVPLLWRQYEAAAISVIEDAKSVKVGKCVFGYWDGFLWIQLPSGRRLAYRKPQIVWRETEYGPRKSIEFLGLSISKKELVLERTWGGSLTENIVQAVARDLMMLSMVRLEDAGYLALLAVHDEAITEKEIGQGSLEQFHQIMCVKPPWADVNLPIDAKSWSGPRYRKEK